MINIPVADFIIGLLIFMRIFAAFIASPIYGHPSIPVLARIFLSIVLSYIVFLTLDKSQITVEFNLAWLFTNAVKEIITGLIFGFMLNFVFHGISYAGMFIGLDMGLSMSDVLNPMDGSSVNVVGQFIYFAAMLIFLLINGHYYIISGLVYSFRIIRLGKFTITEPVYDLLIKYAGTVFIIAVKIASPIMVSFFLVHIAEGIIARVLPQMQIFFVSQPLIIGIGFILLFSLTPIYFYVIKYMLKGYEDNLLSLIKAMGQ